MRESTTESDFAELAVAVYVEELAVDKRVLYVGEPSSGAAERLAAVARSVDVVSRNARARGTRRGGRLRARRWPSEEDDGRWDVVVVPDVGRAGLAEDGQLPAASRWLAEGGVLVAGTAAAGEGAVGYERFFDLLQDAFDVVRMVGQAPFTGYSVVDFAPRGELEVTFDGSLVSDSGEQAARYIALCGERDVALDPYAVVQVPSRVVDAPAPAPAPVDDADDRLAAYENRLRGQQDALDAANVHAEEIERALEGAKEDLGRARRRLDEAERAEREAAAERDSLARKLDALESEARSSDAPGGPTEEEYIRLETALRECGRELTEARAEIERRATLVRDLVEELRAVPDRSAAPTSSPQGVADPIARAVHAEAEKAELGFRLDEVRGELAMAERRAATNLEEIQRTEAALRGTVRGLNARLAEVTELYQQSRARLTLLEDDRRASDRTIQDLTRDLAMAREQLELEIARAHARVEASASPVSARAATDPSGLDPDASDARVAELTAELAEARGVADRLAEEAREAREAGAQAQQQIAELEERIAGMLRGYRLRVAEMTAELDRVGSQAERALIAEGETRAKLEAMQREEANLQGEVAGLKLRLADREAAVQALTAAAALSAPDEGEVELERVREEIARLRKELAPAPQPEPEPEPDAPEAAPEPAPAWPSTEVMFEAQAALVARLQGQLGDALAARRSLERELDRKTAALEVQAERVEEAKVEADVHVGESARELDELQDRLEESETGRRRALAALEDAKAILAKLLGDLPELRPSGDEGGTELRRLRDRVGQLDAAAADRELLLRSLTAQLQERDDRLRALDRLDAAGAGDDDPRVLRARLFEMEERAARLAEELEHEREARRRLEQP